MFGMGCFWLETTTIIKIESHLLNPVVWVWFRWGWNEKKNQNGRLKKLRFSKLSILNIQKAWQPYGWAISMPFASIYPINPMTNPWNFGEKYWESVLLKISVFFESAFFIFLDSFSSKSGKNYGVEWMGLKFYDNCGFQPKTTHPKHSWPKSFNFNIFIPLSKDKKDQQAPFMALG